MKRVVIIEDQTAVREMIAQIVRSEPGFEVVAEVGDGQSALSVCLDEKPDFVILDIMLPGLNGAEVLRRFALSGLGVGWLPETLVADDLATGRLVLAGDARWAVDLPVYAYRLAQRARPLLADVWANLPDDPG